MQIHQKQVEQVMLPKKRCATGIRIWTKWTAVFLLKFVAFSSYRYNFIIFE